MILKKDEVKKKISFGDQELNFSVLLFHLSCSERGFENIAIFSGFDLIFV